MRTLGGSGAASSIWVPATHVGDLDGGLGYWPGPGPALGVVDI